MVKNEIKKTEVIQLRVTPDDKEKLKEQALRRNLSLSDYLITTGLTYEPSTVKAKKVLIGSNHIRGTLNASFTIELIDGEIAAVCRLYEGTRELKGLVLVVGRTIDEIVKLTNPLYTRDLITNWILSVQGYPRIKECFEEKDD